MKSTKIAHHHKSDKKNYLPEILISIYLGFIVSWLVKDKITPFLFHGKEFGARSNTIQILLTTLYTLFFAINTFFIIHFSRRLGSSKKYIEIKKPVYKRIDMQKSIVMALIILWSIMMVWICLETGVQHDYHAYIKQWQLLLEGSPPWSTDNAYGPIHTVIGYLMPFGQLIPKLFFVSLLLIGNFFLVHEILNERGVSKINLTYFIIIPANILIIGIGIIYGLNDTLVAALVVFAIIFRHRGHKIATGILLAVAALIKFYPLLLLPFFALDKKRLDLSIILSGTILTITGFLISLAVWGKGPIEAILFNSYRGTILLSILKSVSSLFGETGFVDFLIHYNTYFIIIGVIITFVFAWKNGITWLESATLGYLVVLTIYKVGHQQFYVPFLFLLASLPLIKNESADYMELVLLPIAIMLSLYQLGYMITDRYANNWRWVRRYGGFIAFPVNLACMAFYITYKFRSRQHSKELEKSGK